MKVAFTTSTGTMIDENFRTAKSFVVWDLAPRQACYVRTVFVEERGNRQDDRIAVRAEAIADCAIVCTKGISGPAAAKLAARNVHPLKADCAGVEEMIGKLQRVLKENPPPWLKKAMEEIPF